MGRDIHIHICKYSAEDNLYHELKLYRKEKEEYKELSPFDGRNYELFEILDDDVDFPTTSIATISLDEELKKKVEDAKTWCFSFREVNFADIKNYLATCPTVVDYEVEWEDESAPPRKENPINWFFKDILSYTELAEGWYYGIDPISRYKLIYWFDN